MRITYIYHSGFSIETETSFLVFDYFKGTVPTVKRDKNVYVFSSHSHRDHFVNEIFDMSRDYDNIRFILAEEIRSSERFIFPYHIKDKLLFMKRNQSLNIDGIQINALPSTDIGVSYLVNVDGKTVFHAGDFNLWLWDNASPEKNQRQEKRFCDTVSLLEGMRIDAAFFPLDPHLAEKYAGGLDYFMRHTETERLFPMHLWEKYEYIDMCKALACTRDYRDRIVGINAPGEIFDI